jgi:D-glycero-alpha-D-manno-heptose-7-phosphate kinase
MNVREGCRVLLHNDAPPGSGLGSSSALVVALTAAISNWRNGVIDRRTLAEKAIQIERVEMGIAGGFQDQYTAAFGGINFMEFRRRETSVEPLHLSKAMQEEMEDSLVLCYTGIIRVSSNIIEDQVNNVVERKGDTLQAMEELKMITSDMRNALLAGRMNSFGRLLQESWEQKKRMSGKISTPKIDEMLAEARNQGACGGKLLGAGGGGYVLLYCPGPAKTLVCQRLQEMGGTIVPWEFEMEGAVTWRSSVPYAMQTVQTGSGPEQEEIA